MSIYCLSTGPPPFSDLENLLFLNCCLNQKSKLHSLSHGVGHSRDWRSCTLSFVSDLVAKTQTPTILNSKFQFPITFQLEFVNGDRDTMLLCPVEVLKNYLSRTEQSCPACTNLFVSLTKRENWRFGGPKTPFCFELN